MWTTAFAAALLAHSGIAPATMADASDDAAVGLITLSGGLADRPDPFGWLTGEPELTLRSVVSALEHAADESDLDAMVLQLEDVSFSRTQIEEIGAAARDLSESGIPVYVVTDALGPGEVLLGSYADTVIAQAGTGLMMPGMYMEELYLRDALEWMGVEPSFVQVGAYKGADEMFNRSEPTAPWEENISQLLDSLYGNMRAQIESGRDLTGDEMDEAMARAWFAEAEDGVELGLIDETLELNALTSQMEERLGQDVSWEMDYGLDQAGMTIDTTNPFAVLSLLSSDPSNDPTGPTIAVLHIDGPIMDGDSVQGGLFGSSSVGSRTIRRLCKTLQNEDLIEGVVVRIDSPGGSATASEVIWRSIRELAEDKPVYVSIGSMAASGGYYIAVAGDRIFVNPSSIVGSIGVVGGKLAIAGLYDKLRINVVERARGPHADLFGSSPWNEAQREVVRDKMTETYDLFTSRVTAGRTGIELDRVAEGRLFTGDRALGLRMADEIGSLNDAIAVMADELDLASYDVLDYPGPQSLEDLLDQMVPGGVSASSPAPAASVLAAGLEAMVGDAWPSLRQRIDAAIMLRNQPVTVLEHRVLHIR